jgi:hypothetical protein
MAIRVDRLYEYHDELKAKQDLRAENDNIRSVRQTAEQPASFAKTGHLED